MAPGTPVARTVRRILAWSGGILLAIVAAAAIVLYVAAETPWGHERVRRMALHALRGTVHGTVRIGALHGDLLHDVAVADVSISDSSGAPFVSARRAEVHYSIRDLLHKHLDFHDVILDHPVVVLAQSATGTWNYARIFPSNGTSSDTSQRGFGSWIAMTNVRVIDGDLTIRTPWHPDSALTGVARDSAIAAALSPDARMVVTAVPDGYEKTIAAHAVTARVDSLRLADPDHPDKARAIRVSHRRSRALPSAGRGRTRSHRHALHRQRLTLDAARHCPDAGIPDHCPSFVHVRQRRSRRRCSRGPGVGGGRPLRRSAAPRRRLAGCRCHGRLARPVTAVRHPQSRCAGRGGSCHGNDWRHHR